MSKKMTPEKKQEFVSNSHKHFEIDNMLAKGTYGRMNGQFKGCSIGCHAHDILPDVNPNELGKLGNIHSVVSDYYGYPEWLARLQDAVFEGLPDEENRKWHVDLAEAYPVNVDEQKLLHEVHLSILRISYKTAGDAQEVVQSVINLHERVVSGEEVDSAEWSAARSAATSAARLAADSAAWSAAMSAAWSAAWSAARLAAWSAARLAADSAADSAAWSAAMSAAWSAAYQEIRDAVLLVLANHKAGK